MSNTHAAETRRYNSPARREQAAETRERIIGAGAELVHEEASWDWARLTVRAVATRAGVHERTVHRHFATERDLRGAIMQRLFEESGVSIEGLRLEDVPGHVEQLFDYLASFSLVAHDPHRPADPVVAEMVGRRKAALLKTVEEQGSGLEPGDLRIAAAMLDLLSGVPSYQLLVSQWGLDGAEAARGVNWLVRLLSDAIRGNCGPA